MIGDYDDDAHFCLKCHSTIIGLDNYVDHRKTGCNKILVETSSKSPCQILRTDESLGLKADDFFSSLELQSSAKKTAAPSTSGKTFSGILTRSKVAVIQASTKENLTEKQEERETKRKDNIEEYQDSDEEIEEDFYYDEYEDESSDEYAPPRNYTGGKWKPTSPIQWGCRNFDEWTEPPPPTHTGGKWKPKRSHKEDFEIPPPTHTKGKWKPRSYLEEEQETDHNAPPVNHTKGKWKPKEEEHEVPPPSHTKGKWKPKEEEHDVPPPSHTKGKWKPRDEEQDVPPPSHTKGKWKPKFNEEETLGPSPSHTKGKWKPKSGEETEISPKEKTIAKTKLINETPKVKHKPIEEVKKHKEEKKIKPEEIKPKQLYTKVKWTESQPIKMNTLEKSSGSIQYWCSPCNRRLSSKVVYERHLKSELHFKRTSQDREFDDGADLNLSKRTLSKPPEPIFSENKIDDNIQMKKKRKRRRVYERCGVCQSKVNTQLIGKHLISHYHCRKGNINTSLAKSMVLDNILGIVLQSPFQCSVCRFYCNTHDYFIKHWLSEMHIKTESTLNGYYICSFCKFHCETNNEMYSHLISNEHKDVVAVINRSVPIIVQKIQPIYCITCKARFSLNIELLNHCRKFNHDIGNVQLNKSKYKCNECNQIFHKNISLQRHYKNVHNKNYFICSVCNLEFDSIARAKKHRNTDLHRANLNKTKKIDMKKKCEYCNEIFESFLKYKEHLRLNHEEYLPKCPHCGAVFNVAQELTVHLRTKACKFEEITKEPSAHKCDKCNFGTNTLSEYFYHQALHEEPLIIHSFDNKKSIIQYKCNLCQKYFPKSSLEPHLRQHTNEKPFVCRLCNASFARKNNWKTHERNHEKKKDDKMKVKLTIGNRPFLCSTCGANFMKKSILKQHMQVHTGKLFKCDHPGCIHTARKMSELKTHYLTHTDVKNFACNICDYKGKTKTHLKRHMSVHDTVKKYECPKCSFTSRNSWHLKRHLRLHTGAKPYNCPYCSYSCNTMENIRKHILMTNKHPGKCIYECKFCTTERFQSNFAIEFKAHLVNQHGDMFANVTAALTYITGIYEPQEEDTSMYIDVHIDQSDEEINISRNDRIIHQVNETILSLHANDDPIVAQLEEPSTSSASVAAIIKDSNFDEGLPMFVISKDEITGENQSDTWNLVGRYDVEESGTLVPFQSDGETLFQEHFQ